MGLTEPQLELWQVTVQSTPRFDGSFATVATNDAAPPVCREDGGGWVRVMAMGGPAIVTVTVTFLVLSAVDAAVMFTLLPTGSEAGAVNVVGAPLAV
jgi:hypothetical protein